MVNSDPFKGCCWWPSTMGIKKVTNWIWQRWSSQNFSSGNSHWDLNHVFHLPIPKGWILKGWSRDRFFWRQLMLHSQKLTCVEPENHPKWTGQSSEPNLHDFGFHVSFPEDNPKPLLLKGAILPFTFHRCGVGGTMNPPRWCNLRCAAAGFCRWKIPWVRCFFPGENGGVEACGTYGWRCHCIL